MLMEEFGSDTDDEDYLPQGEEEKESWLEIVLKRRFVSTSVPDP